MAYYRFKNKIIFAMVAAYSAALCLFTFNAYADDKEAQSELKEAAEEYKAGNYYDAAKAYEGAVLYADSTDIKFEALKKAADAYGKAGQKYKQFKCIDELIIGFPDRIDLARLVEKEYEIANDFAKGHRDTPLSWLPWIKGENKATEIMRLF